MKKLYKIEQIRECERQLIQNGITEEMLINRAIDGLFDFYSPKNAIFVCGKGNNGADCLGLAIKHFKNNKKVTVMLLDDALKTRQKNLFSAFVDLKIPTVDYFEGFDFSSYSEVFDGLLGIGFKGDVGEKYKSVIIDINNSANFVVSIDVPSGLNADNGLTNLSVKSDLNLAVGGLKTGLILNQAKDFIVCNKTVDIGFEMETNISLFEDSDMKNLPVERLNFSHKGTYGKVGIFGGSLNFCGAPKLSFLAYTALRSGSGLSRLIIPDCLLSAILPKVKVETLFPIPSQNGSVIFDKSSLILAFDGLDALVFGMGLTQTTHVAKILEYILTNLSIKLVIDADGINILKHIDQNTLKSTACKVVITPHIAEFSRLVEVNRSEIIKNPIIYAEDYARKNNIIVLLKGSATIVTDGNKTYILNSGCSGMATAGSGDVLDGILAGFLSFMPLDVMTVCMAAHLNGRAGEFAAKKVGNLSQTALDTIENIPKAIKKLCSM